MGVRGTTAFRIAGVGGASLQSPAVVHPPEQDGEATLRSCRRQGFVARVGRHVRAALLAMVALPSAGGCRLVHRHSPAPERVAEARRLSSEGLTAAGQQDLAGAEVLLAQAVKRCPTDIDARRHYALVLWQRGERMAAFSQIDEALRIAPDDESLCLAGGRMTLDLGLLDDADRLAASALRAAPQAAEAWHLHGQVALARGRPEEALADFHRGLAIRCDDRGLLLDAAEVYRRLGRPQRALSTLACLSDTYGPQATPGLVRALEGMAQEALGRVDDARDSYREALARGGAPSDTEARLAHLDPAGSTAAPHESRAATSRR